MWSRKVADSTTMASTHRATGFLGLFLLRRLLNQEDRCSSCETGSTVLLSEKHKPNHILGQNRIVDLKVRF